MFTQNNQSTEYRPQRIPLIRWYWCDEIGHSMNDCDDLDEYIGNGLVQELNGRVCVLNGYQYLLNVGSGGIKRLVDEEHCIET